YSLLCLPPLDSLFPYTTLFRSSCNFSGNEVIFPVIGVQTVSQLVKTKSAIHQSPSKSSELTDSSSWFVKEKSLTVSDIFSSIGKDRKSTRLNSSHVSISYAVFC